jgi:SAM-dependent methyltransferase
LFEGADLLHGKPGRFPAVQCAACGSTYLASRPTRQEIGAYYPQDYMPHELARQANRRWLARLDYRYGLTKRCRLLMRHRAPGRLLDVGCATGEFLVRARELGWEPYGVDLSEYAVQYAREHWNLPAERGDLLDVPYPDGFLDAITLWNVFEHLYAPLESLDRASQLLAPGGIFVLTVPNLGSLDRALFGSAWSGYDVPRHLHVFSVEALRQACAERGLEPVEMRCLYGSYHAFLLSLRFYLQARGRAGWLRLAEFAARSRVLRVLCVPLFVVLDRVKRGTILTVVCRKRDAGAGRAGVDGSIATKDMTV